MKSHHTYFFILKLILTIQLVLIFFKKHSTESKLYIISDTIFKISIALFLFVFFYLNSFPGLDWQDAIILRFSGIVLLYDINYNGLIKIAREYIPMLPKIPILEYDYVVAPISIA
jgi:hypothetical protein